MIDCYVLMHQSPEGSMWHCYCWEGSLLTGTNESHWISVLLSLNCRHCSVTLTIVGLTNWSLCY